METFDRADTLLEFRRESLAKPFWHPKGGILFQIKSRLENFDSRNSLADSIIAHFRVLQHIRRKSGHHPSGLTERVILEKLPVR
jgi:hypothetical protein